MRGKGEKGMQKTKFYASYRVGLIVGGISLMFFLVFGLVFGFVLDPYFSLLLWIMPVVPAVIGFATGWLSAKWRKASPLSPIKGSIIAGLSAWVLTSLGWIIGIVIIDQTTLKDIYIWYKYDLLLLILLVPLISMFTASWIGSCRRAESVNGKNTRLEILRKFLRHIFHFGVCIIVFLYVGKQTFFLLFSAAMIDRYYSHNRKFIYWQGKKIIGSDGSSFERLGSYTVRDKNFVYYRGERIKSVDIDSLKLLGREYAKDKNYVFWEMTRIPEADVETFEVIKGSMYARDKDFVYYDGKRIPGADAESFEVIGSSLCYAKDKNYVYFLGKKVEGADRSSFMTLEHPYAKDKNLVYYYGNKIIGADVDSFEILKCDYAKDKQSVYYKDKKIEGSDRSTFEIPVREYGEKCIAEDKNFIYRWGKKKKKIR